MADNRDHLGKGWRFPVSVNLTGGVSSSAFEENVRQSIFIILGTAPGERINRPDFGCRIHDLMFAPNNPMTAARAEIYCEEAIYKYEPRVDSVKVRATQNPGQPNVLDLKVEYVISTTNVPRNLVFPFYLQDPNDPQSTNGVPKGTFGSNGT